MNAGAVGKVRRRQANAASTAEIPEATMNKGASGWF
jgi:hypothetical protein